MRESNLKARLIRIGTGQGILLKKPVCDLMNIDVGDELLLDLQEGRLIIKPVENARREVK